MDNVNWLTMLIALGLGVLVGTAFLVVGTLMDRARERRWDEELHFPRQRDGGHDDDGA